MDSGIRYYASGLPLSGRDDPDPALWDQSIPGNPPDGYAIGTEYTQAQINVALAVESREEREQMIPSRDISGHGTAVAGIAAGSGEYQGVAPASELIVVKMASPSRWISKDNRIDAGSRLCDQESGGVSNADCS